MAEPATPLNVGIYGRQSRDKTRSIDEQLAECRTDATGQGWTIAETYSDGVSASRFTTKVRDEWQRVLSDVDAKRLDVLILWESSRGDRDPETWLGLLAKCRTRQVLIRVTSHHHTYDMTNPRDWRTLAEDGIDNAYESEKLAIRVRRAMTANATAGKPHGPTPYGYERIYDPVTRKLVEQRPDPDTAPIVREIITRISKGEPIVEVCNGLNLRGVPAPSGGQWHRSRIREVASNPAYIGKRRHNGTITDGSWKGLIDEATWYAAQRVLTDPRRKTTKPGRIKHLLSYVAVCGVCGTGLHATRRHRGMAYHCSATKGCTSIKLEWLDEYVTLLVCARLARADIYPAVVQADDAAVLAARGEAGELRARLEGFYVAAADGKLTPEGLAATEARLLPQIEAAELRAIQAATPPVLRELLSPDGNIRERWDRSPVAARKETVALLFESIRLLPATRPGTKHTTFDQGLELAAERVEIKWRE